MANSFELADFNGELLHATSTSDLLENVKSVQRLTGVLVIKCGENANSLSCF